MSDITLASASKPRYQLLLVDDDELILMALHKLLGKENYDIKTCNNPLHAIEILKKDRFHLVVSDYMMPQMNGGEFFKMAKSIQPDCIRILLSSHTDVDAVVRAVKEGSVYKFILKPWNNEDLCHSVSLALDYYEISHKNTVLVHEKQLHAKEMHKMSQYCASSKSKLAYFLHKKGFLNQAMMSELLEIQTKRNEASIRLILEKKWIKEKDIYRFISEFLKMSFTDLDEYIIDHTVSSLIPSLICINQCVVPLKVVGKRLLLGMADPLDDILIENLRFTTGLDIVPVLAKIDVIDRKVKDIYKIGAATIDDLQAAFHHVDVNDGLEFVSQEDEFEGLFLDDVSSEDGPPAIQLVNSILLDAIKMNASDIHIQPQAKNINVRLRVDGVLVDKLNIPIGLHQSIISRIKVMAELDISERRRPQDGRITVRTPKRTVDLRISTLPSLNGEKLVIRILDRNATILSLDQLGFPEHLLESIYLKSTKPQGIILATGPTGSGKTTTLYSLVQHSSTSEKNVITIEDPVEYYLSNACQVFVKEKIGLTFPLVLRSVLRQDPDMILIGEIRDSETAEVAFHAALTGHQVFSTLHTNSAFATLSRLFDLGLKPYAIAAALEAVIAQRLLRRLCHKCVKKVAPDKTLMQRLQGKFLTAGLKEVCQAKGCTACHYTGYQGRIGLYEILLFDDTIRMLITTQAPFAELTRYISDNGFLSLRDDAFLKVEAGLTSLEEVNRVLGPG